MILFCVYHQVHWSKAAAMFKQLLQFTGNQRTESVEKLSFHADHEKRELEFFCNACELGIFNACALTDHDSHDKMLLELLSNDRKLRTQVSEDRKLQDE